MNDVVFVLLMLIVCVITVALFFKARRSDTPYLMTMVVIGGVCAQMVLIAIHTS